MGVIANVQGIVIVNSSLIGLHTATDCSVTPVGHACLFTAYSYMLVLIFVIVIYGKACCTVAKYFRVFVKSAAFI